MAKSNPNTYSSVNMKVTKGADRQTQFASKSVLGKVSPGARRRAPEYQLENLKK